MGWQAWISLNSGISIEISIYISSIVEDLRSSPPSRVSHRWIHSLSPERSLAAAKRIAWCTPSILIRGGADVASCRSGC
ncbi:hypothetical protein I7I48_11175 [Histoplasma ohiense]|nr:hypothetical protein I7I48_11175 [Histoplasma ohiense (nom. inval.)]